MAKRKKAAVKKRAAKKARGTGGRKRDVEDRLGVAEEMAAITEAKNAEPKAPLIAKTELTPAQKALAELEKVLAEVRDYGLGSDRKTAHIRKAIAEKVRQFVSMAQRKPGMVEQAVEKLKAEHAASQQKAYIDYRSIRTALQMIEGRPITSARDHALARECGFVSTVVCAKGHLTGGALDIVPSVPRVPLTPRELKKRKKERQGLLKKKLARKKETAKILKKRQEG